MAEADKACLTVCGSRGGAFFNSLVEIGYSRRLNGRPLTVRETGGKSGLRRARWSLMTTVPDSSGIRKVPQKTYRPTHAAG